MLRLDLSTHPLTWLRQARGIPGTANRPFSPARWANPQDLHTRPHDLAAERQARALAGQSGQEETTQVIGTRPERLQWQVTAQDLFSVTLGWTLEIGGTNGERLARALQDTSGQPLTPDTLYHYDSKNKPVPACALVRLPGRRLLIPGQVTCTRAGVRLTGYVSALLVPLPGEPEPLPALPVPDLEHPTWTAGLTLERHGSFSPWVRFHAAPWTVLALRTPGGEILIPDRIQAQPTTDAQGTHHVRLTLTGRHRTAAPSR